MDFFLGNRPRTATAVAGDEPCILYVVPRAAFDTLRLKSPEVSSMQGLGAASWKAHSIWGHMESFLFDKVDCRDQTSSFWCAGADHPDDSNAAVRDDYRDACCGDTGSQPGVTFYVTHETGMHCRLMRPDTHDLGMRIQSEV